MYRFRTRPKYSDEELKEIYKTPHDHTRWPDHIVRVEKTIEVGLRMTDDSFSSIADLSCGNTAVIRGVGGVAGKRPVDVSIYLGDFAPGYGYQGPIEETIDRIPCVDLFVCSETIEHLDDPELVLRKIRQKSSKLLLSTPNCSWPDQNPEHYWSWDDEAVRAMLIDTGWDPVIYEESYIGMGYNFQIWGCR